jgi:hypothetical protein
MLRAGIHHDLSQCKQEQNKTLRSYTRRFFNTRATIANICDEDVIDCFQNGFVSGTSTATLDTTGPTTSWNSRHDAAMG